MDPKYKAFLKTAGLTRSSLAFGSTLILTMCMAVAAVAVFADEANGEAAPGVEVVRAVEL